MSGLLAASGVVLAAVAVGVGPRLEASRLDGIGYGVPFVPTLVAAALLAASAVSRRVPVLAAAVTLTLATVTASLAAAHPLRYPIAVVGDGLLLIAAGVLVLGARRLPPPAPAPAPANPVPGPLYGPLIDPWPRPRQGATSNWVSSKH